MEYHKEPTVASLLDEFIVNFPCQMRMCREIHKDPAEVYRWFDEHIYAGWLSAATLPTWAERIPYLYGWITDKARTHFRVGTREAGKRNGILLSVLVQQLVGAMLSARTRPR